MVIFYVVKKSNILKNCIEVRLCIANGKFTTGLFYCTFFQSSWIKRVISSNRSIHLLQRVWNTRLKKMSTADYYYHYLCHLCHPCQLIICFLSCWCLSNLCLTRLFGIRRSFEPIGTIKDGLVYFFPNWKYFWEEKEFLWQIQLSYTVGITWRTRRNTFKLLWYRIYEGCTVA